MSFEAEFTDLMFDTVTIRPYVGQDGYGRPTYGPAQVFQCRIVGRTRKVINYQGEEKLATTEIILLNSPGINPRSQLTLPANYNPQQPPILTVLRQPDDQGAITEIVYS